MRDTKHESADSDERPRIQYRLWDEIAQVHLAVENLFSVVPEPRHVQLRSRWWTQSMLVAPVALAACLLAAASVVRGASDYAAIYLAIGFLVAAAQSFVGTPRDLTPYTRMMLEWLDAMHALDPLVADTMDPRIFQRHSELKFELRDYIRTVGGPEADELRHTF